MILDNNQLLKFLLAGSEDDGKSTLIGRLLNNSKSIFEHQLQAIGNTSKKKGLDSVNLSLYADALNDEREQRTTIDLVYHYFTMLKCKFIIAGTPGHIQYT